MYVARILILNHDLGTRSHVHASDSELGYNQGRNKQLNTYTRSLVKQVKHRAVGSNDLVNMSS